jgi:hypothetical protein
MLVWPHQGACGVKEANATVELKRTGNGIHTFGTTLLAALLVGYEVLVTAHLITAGDLGAVFNPLGLFASIFVFFALIATLTTCFMVWALTMRSRRFRLLADRDPAVVFCAPVQPNRTLALHDGESFTLSYRSRGNRWFQGLAMLIFCLVLAAFGEALVFSTLPAFGHSQLNPFYLEILYPPAATAPPTLLDWLTAAFPLALSAVCLVALLWGVVTSAPHTLRADDRGITSRHAGRGRIIPWNDMLLFARTLSDARTTPVGTYVVWGRSHFLMFSIVDVEHVDTGAKSRDSVTLYIVDGGYEAYLSNAARLLATIAARSYAPLLAMREPPIMGRFRRRAPVTTTSEEEARELPIAAQAYQPHATEADASLRFGEQLLLRARMPVVPVLAESLLWMAAIGVFMIPFVRQPDFINSLFAVGPIVGVIAIAFCIALLGSVAVAFAIQRRTLLRPGISVDGFGIASRQQGDKKPVAITWQSITAWVVVPAPPGSLRPTRYIVFGDGQKIAWAEPADAQLAGRGVKGDRRQAYRERAARIHALIAARTELPLRELRVDATQAIPARAV